MWLDDTDRSWHVETSIQKYINKFRKMGWIEVKTTKYKDGSDCIVEFEAPEFAVSIRKPMKKVVSENHKAIMAENMKNFHKTKKLSKDNED